jgi:flagellar biosynthesis/type III secretory pathway protein FliH
LNPRDIETLAERGEPVAEAFQSFEKIEIAADESVPHGGCTIETKIVDVDARLDTQLMRIFDALEG